MPHRSFLVVLQTKRARNGCFQIDCHCKKCRDLSPRVFLDDESPTLENALRLLAQSRHNTTLTTRSDVLTHFAYIGTRGDTFKVNKND